MAAILLSLAWITSFWFAYWLGWSDAKMDEQFNRDLDKLVKWAERGIRITKR